MSWHLACTRLPFVPWLFGERTPTSRPPFSLPERFLPSATHSSYRFTNPVHLYSGHSPRIRLLSEYEFIIHDCLNFPPKQHRTGMNSDRLLSRQRLVRPIGHQKRCIG